MKTLIIPTVGMSNVPQLVVEQLLVWNRPQSVAKLDPTYLYPYVATNALVTHSPLELYSLPEQAYVVQLHSPVLPGYEQQFADQIARVLLEHSIDRIVVIDSKDRGEAIGWEWFSTRASLVHLEDTLAQLSLAAAAPAAETVVKEVQRVDTCPLVKLLQAANIDIDYYAVRVYEGPNGPAVGEMAHLVAQKEGLNTTN